MKIEVYSDGSATTNDKPGGWGYVLVINGTKYSEGSGHAENVSNNDMEMEAAIRGLAAALKWINESGNNLIDLTGLREVEVTLCSDSQLILGWASGTYRFKQTSKIEKYKQLKFLVHRLGAKTRWVQGHNGDEHNERCDKLANEARTGIVKEQEKALASGKTLIGVKKRSTLCIWYKNCLKVIDLESNVIEDYNRELHGKRGSVLEVKEDKLR